MTARARVPHIIKPNKSGAAPQAWVAFALTTNKEKIDERRTKHTVRQIAAIYWQPERTSKSEALEYRTFSDANAFVRWSISQIRSKQRLAVVCHDMDFAAQVLDFHCIVRTCGFRATRVIIEKGKWQQRWKEGRPGDPDGSRTLLMLDLRNFFPASLRLISQWLSVPYPRASSDEVEWLDSLDGAEWRATVTLRALQAWQDFRNRFDLGYFSATLAGQAFNAYRHRFMTHPIYVHCHPDVIAMEKEANYGGRTDLIYRGRAPKDDYVQVDVTSFYASVMRGNQFPTKQVGHYRNVGLLTLHELTRKYSVIARVELATEVPAYPYRKDGHVTFPVGRFVTTLCTPEIQLALRRSDIARCEELIVYEQAPIFDEYVDFFWNLRRYGMKYDDKYIVELAKRFLTAVFGKFGQKVWLNTLVSEDAVGADRIWREYDWQDSMEYEYRIIAGRLERSVREMLGRDTLLAIPAHVTSYGRAELWRLMEKAGREHIYYVDTDSFIGRKVILNNLGNEFANKTLGGLRLVKTSSHLFIRAPKWYIFGDVTKRAGVPNTAFEVEHNVFEGDEQRSMHWALLHDSPCQAVVERTRVVGPLRDKLSSRALGSFVPPPRLGPTPTELPGRYLQYPLPARHPDLSETIGAL